MSEAIFQPLSSYTEYPLEEMKQRAVAFRKEMQRRRTVRDFSNRPVPREIIEECLLTAGSAPNGANLQPWQFVVISDPRVKHEIRVAAEQEEQEFYHRRAPQEWLEALSVIGTDEHKPFLADCPRRGNGQNAGCNVSHINNLKALRKFTSNFRKAFAVVSTVFCHIPLFTEN